MTCLLSLDFILYGFIVSGSLLKKKKSQKGTGFRETSWIVPPPKLPLSILAVELQV